MFKIEIHGYFKAIPAEREIKNIDFVVDSHTQDKYCFANPHQAESFTKDYIVISFHRNDLSPYLPVKMLDYYLDKFKAQKDKILIELLFCCTDINITKREKKYLSLNQATMNSFKYQATIFYNEADDIFYYTYENDGLHIVWLENTETILNKVKLIKKSGYRGIFIRDVPLALDGNWEALYKLKN